jgi:hypothetical protein
VIACVTPKYVVSHHCNRELSLADLVRKPIIPVMVEDVVWPPPGAMALIFSQYVYINMKGNSHLTSVCALYNYYICKYNKKTKFLLVKCTLRAKL